MSGLMEKWKLEWLNEGKAEGKAEGEKLGEERGKITKATSIAQGMKKKGFNIELIMELTGLSKEKILTL